MDFTHYTDHSVALAVELVNSLDVIGGGDSLDDPATLSFLLDEYPHEAKIGPEQLATIVLVRRRIREIFESDSAEQAAAVINDLLSTVSAVPRVSVHSESPPHLHFEPSDAGPGRWLGATTAMGLATVLCEWGFERLGVCASSGCHDVFVDTSRNCSRRFCSDTCSTRESVAAYRQRQRPSI